MYTYNNQKVRIYVNGWYTFQLPSLAEDICKTNTRLLRISVETSYVVVHFCVYDDYPQWHSRVKYECGIVRRKTNAISKTVTATTNVKLQ